MRFFKKLAIAALLTAQAQSVKNESAEVKQPRATWRELLQIMNKDEDDTSPSILARGKKNSATGAAGWGRQPKNKFVEYKTCPMLETPKNAKGVFCDGATCVVDCLAGFMPAGNPRVNCVRNKAPKFVEKGENRWSADLPDCQACEELPPIFDQNIDQFCFVNARDNQMTCEHQCTNGGKLTGLKGSVLRCVCNQQGTCGWSRKAKKAKFADTSKARCTEEFVLPPQRSSCEEKSILEFSTEAARITNSNDCKKCKLLTLDTRFPPSFDSDDTVILELSQPLKSVGTFSFPVVSAELAEDQTAITLTFYEYADMSEKDVRMFLNIESKRKTPEVIGITTRPCSAKRSEFSVSPNSKGGGYGSTTSSVVSTTGTTTTTGIDGSGIYSAGGGNNYSNGGSSGSTTVGPTTPYTSTTSASSTTSITTTTTTTTTSTTTTTTTATTTTTTTTTTPTTTTTSTTTSTTTTTTTTTTSTTTTTRTTTTTTTTTLTTTYTTTTSTDTSGVVSGYSIINGYEDNSGYNLQGSKEDKKKNQNKKGGNKKGQKKPRPSKKPRTTTQRAGTKRLMNKKNKGQ